MASRAQWSAFLGDALRQTGAELSPGLTGTELAAVEAAAGARLPTELRVMLGLAVPVGQRAWRDWHVDPAGQLATWQEYVIEGLVLDARHNDFWAAGWGPRPADPADREALVRRQAAALPRLFPVFGHRGLAIDPPPGHESADGNPVFSVVQSDVVHYGCDLAGWLSTEFGVPLPDWAAREPRRIPFWSALTGPAR